MSSFKKTDIESVFNEKGIQFPVEEFIQALEQKESKRKELKKAKLAEEAAKPETFVLSKSNILPAPDDNQTAESLIKKVVKKNDYWELFYDYDGIDDDGADEVEIFIVGDKVYFVDIHCEAEWCSDFSVRKNLPGEVSVAVIRELSGCTTREKDGDTIVEVPRHYFPKNN